uniref:non-specific serine/threonine protein kinase n=1 Tax=Wollemia nobilis TaxID=56998 RepID=A0A0C9RXN7_9CONI
MREGCCGVGWGICNSIGPSSVFDMPVCRSDYLPLKNQVLPDPSTPHSNGNGLGVLEGFAKSRRQSSYPHRRHFSAESFDEHHNNSEDRALLCYGEIEHSEANQGFEPRPGFYAERKALQPFADPVNLIEYWKPSYYSSRDHANRKQPYTHPEHEQRKHSYRELWQIGAIGATGAPDFDQRKNSPSYSPTERSVHEQRKGLGFWVSDHPTEDHGFHRGNNWLGDRNSTGSNSPAGGRVQCASSTGLQRQSSGSSYSDSFLSGDFPLTTLSPTVSLNANDSAFFNALYDDGCKYDDPRPVKHSNGSLKSWAQQTEESYNLQLTLALRLTAEATSTEGNDLHFFGNQVAPHTAAVDSATKVEAASYRFWVNGSLSYYDKIEDGFYHIWGMNPYVWTVCNNLDEGHQMPSLESLKSVDPMDSSMEVVLIDKQADSHLRELQNKTLVLAYASTNTRQVAEELGKLVCMLMGGTSLTEDGDLMMRWKANSKMLRDCLNSIVLPMGSLSVGLCKHRALLFKALADIIDLPCRIVQGCKYCGLSDGSSCLVQCDVEREYLVDLIGSPGELSDPMSLVSGSTFLSIASPLRMPELKSFHITDEVRSLARQYSHDNKSLNDLFDVANSSQVAGPFEDTSRVSSASTSEQVTIEPAVSCPNACTDKKSTTTIVAADVTNFAGKRSMFNMMMHGEGLNTKVDKIHVPNKSIFSTERNGTRPPKLTDFSVAVRSTKLHLEKSWRMPSISKAGDDNLQHRHLPVHMKGDMVTKNGIQNSCEKDKCLVEHGKITNAECPQETVLPMHMQKDVQPKLQVSHNKGEDGRLKQAGGIQHNRITLELSLAMDGLEIPWEDLVLKERIGSGSFGTVHHADWHGSEVAVKILIDQDLHDDRLKEFLREVAIMKRLRHPNVVLFMGAVTKRPNLSIVTEYLPRGSLYRLIHRAGARELLDERRRLRMALDVAKGINYLHQLNPPIVHRDLKSPNLLVDKTWTVKVCDFGLSRFKANTFISSKSAAGTPEWMAPEVLRDEPSNEKSDVYSFGVILWELVTMQQPWSGLSPAQVVGAVGFQNRRLTIPQDMHPEIAAIIEACWANDPRQRPSFLSIMESLKPLVKSSAAQSVHGNS